MINKPLIHFQKKSSFENALNNGEITDKSLCFIKDVQEIYTHGQLYSCHFGANLNVDKIEADKENKGLKITFANNGTTIISLTDILDETYASITKIQQLQDTINTKQDKITSTYSEEDEMWTLKNL